MRYHHRDASDHCNHGQPWTVSRSICFFSPQQLVSSAYWSSVRTGSRNSNKFDKSNKSWLTDHRNNTRAYRYCWFGELPPDKRHSLAWSRGLGMGVICYYPNPHCWSLPNFPPITFPILNRIQSIGQHLTIIAAISGNSNGFPSRRCLRDCKSIITIYAPSFFGAGFNLGRYWLTLFIAVVKRLLPAGYLWPPKSYSGQLAKALTIGALVLAHSLRDAGTTKKLAVLVTDSVSADATAELQVWMDSTKWKLQAIL